jgi:aryl-alcohol dehydrogenase-like predicted oxidoreductase
MPHKKDMADPILPRPELYHMPFTTEDFQGMPYRNLGSSGLRVPRVGLGTWKFGYPETGDGSRISEAKAFKILDRAVEEGVTFWDTANRYNNSSGNSERIIGRWFAANPSCRRDVQLATKIYSTMDGRTPNHCRLSRNSIMEATYASLERLQTDWVDVLQFHWFDDLTPPEESLLAMEDLIAQDLVRYFGVSNFSVAQLEQYRVYEDIFRRAKIRSVQNQFDILYGESHERRGVIEYCAKKGLSFIPWSPLRWGLISERYLDRSKIKPGARLVDEHKVEQELTKPVVKKLHDLAALAHKWELTLTQLAIAYMLHLPGLGPVIPACSSAEQVTENAKAGKLTLKKQQVDGIERILKHDRL